MSLADIYCLVCNKIDGQAEVEDDRDTIYIIHKDCAKSHNGLLKRAIHGQHHPPDPGDGTRTNRDSKGRFLPKSK